MKYYESEKLMGLIPPPRTLTKKEYLDNNGRDIEFEKWFRYSGVIGSFKLIINKIFNKEIK